MLIKHEGKSPRVHPAAFVAPTAVVCGDVTIGPDSQIGFGAVILAEGGAIKLGDGVIVRENALIRATPGFPVHIGHHVLIGPQASLMGCQVEDEVFLATGAAIFHGARIGRGAEVRINGVVHLKTCVPAGATVPIGWVAVGDPAEILPPHEHERIWEKQQPLDFPGTVYGVRRDAAGKVDMKQVTGHLARRFQMHRNDVELGEEP